jgi:adenosylcobinamide hydrolase|tara:strand:- start:781 stop:1509 length:729 start_codon:yes stop_codon:yes gene_type:complete
MMTSSLTNYLDDIHSRRLLDGVVLSKTAEYIHLAFAEPRRALSSAVFNGGLCWASHWLNYKVPLNCPLEVEEPMVTLENYTRNKGWQGDSVGMMTAASMNSLRIHSSEIEGENIVVLSTTGIANALRAGDSANYALHQEVVREVGTINTAIITSATLSDAAMVETHMISTEAKAAVFQQFNIKSTVSEGIATGTGTDSTLVVSGLRSTAVRFAGKHTQFAEQVARLTMASIADSLITIEAAV